MNDEFYVGLSNAMMLLILAVTGNFVAETLSCKTQYALTNNMYLKHLVILFMIYFTLNFTTDDNPHPKRALKNAIIIWALFVLFGKTTPNFTIAIAALLVIIYILKNLREHYKHKIKNKQKSKHLDNKLLQLQSKLLNIALRELNCNIPETLFYSFVNLPGGKMSTRAGRVVYLDDN